MSQPWREPSRITGSQIAVMPGGDIAEAVSDSRGSAWARWYSAGTNSWSAWRYLAEKTEAVAIAGPYTAPGDAARLAETGSTAEAVLVAVVGRSPEARSWFRLTAAGVAPMRL